MWLESPVRQLKRRDEHQQTDLRSRAHACSLPLTRSWCAGVHGERQLLGGGAQLGQGEWGGGDLSDPSHLALGQHRGHAQVGPHQLTQRRGCEEEEKLDQGWITGSGGLQGHLRWISVSGRTV